MQESTDISYSVQEDSTKIPEYLAVPSCMFQRIDLHPDATQLVEEFLRRDAAGQFLQTDKWFEGATTCPGHEPGPDAWLAMADYHFDTLIRTDTVAQFTVTYWILGSVIPAVSENAFRPDERMLVDTLSVLNTPFGWRVESPALLQRVIADTVLARPWLPAEDRQELAEALARRRG